MTNILIWSLEYIEDQQEDSEQQALDTAHLHTWRATMAKVSTCSMRSPDIQRQRWEGQGHSEWGGKDKEVDRIAEDGSLDDEDETATNDKVDLEDDAKDGTLLDLGQMEEDGLVHRPSSLVGIRGGHTGECAGDKKDREGEESKASP